MKGILLTSHGDFAKGLHHTLSMFCGDLSGVDYACLQESEEIPAFLNKLKTKIDNLDSGDGVVVFCDLLHGTPYNCVVSLMKRAEYKNRLTLISGMNLGMVMECVVSMENTCDIDYIVRCGKEAIVNYKVNENE